MRTRMPAWRPSGTSFLFFHRDVPLGGGLAAGAQRPKPAAEHPADFIHLNLCLRVFLQVNRAGVFGKPQEDAQYVEIHADSFQDCNLLPGRLLARPQQSLDDCEHAFLRPLPERVPVLFRYAASPTAEELVEIVCFREDGDLQFFHACEYIAISFLRRFPPKRSSVRGRNSAEVKRADRMFRHSHGA